MGGLTKLARRWLGWLAAITYLLASLTPTLAVRLPADLIEPLNQVNHLAPDAHEHAHGHNLTRAHEQGGHQHGPAGALMAYAEPAADSPDGHDGCDQQNQHGNCCGSVLCMSAVAPQLPLLAQFEPMRSRGEYEPASMCAGERFGPLYRPPIA